MKTLTALSIIMLLVLNSCKHLGCDPAHMPKTLNFEVIDKTGKSLVNFLTDTVTVTYFLNSSNDTLRLTVKKLNTNPQDTTAVSAKYNGLYITDNAQLSILSSQSPPVNTFNLSINGVSEGIIYINYTQYQMSYPQLTPSAFTFNNLPVTEDTSTGINEIELLQTN